MSSSSCIRDIEDYAPPSKARAPYDYPSDPNDYRSTDIRGEDDDEYYHHELRHDTNLSELFDDRYKDALGENPYYHIDREIAKKMNVIQDHSSVVKPVHANSNKIDEAVLRKFTEDILSQPLDKQTLDTAIKAASRKYKIIPKKMDLFYMYSLICTEKGESISPQIRGLLQTNPFRSQSGVMVYSVFTSPFFKITKNGEMRNFSCKHNCRMCPDMPGYPRSYVPGEPGNDRAAAVDYDTIKQVYIRASAYMVTGHVNDKAEVIVLGGTWHSYPLVYREMFITLLYYAFNTIHENRGRPVMTMEEEIKLNRTSKCRVIGLTIETRPDEINPKALMDMRRMGVTRVQLGVQHTDDRILTRINRGCTAEDSVNSIKLLKDSNYKVDIHLMPDLPKPFKIDFVKKNKHRINHKDFQFTKDAIDWDYDSVGSDTSMFDEVFHSERYCPDQVKIYPTSTMDWTGIKKDHEEGTYVPYGTIEPDQETNPLIELLIKVKSTDFPYMIRINRLIRDIPEGYILGGIKDAGGRQRIEQMMKKRGLKCTCIRCREIKKKQVDPNYASLRITKYRASGGDEYFLEYITPNDEIIGFLRMRVSPDSGYHIVRDKNGNIVSRELVFGELVDAAMIRELHVYGETVKVRRSDSTDEIKEIDRTHQHAGFGTRLLHSSFVLAKMLGYSKMTVIPGVGVEMYYERKEFGFKKGEYFHVKDLTGNDLDTTYASAFILDDIIVRRHRFDTPTQLTAPSPITSDITEQDTTVQETSDQPTPDRTHQMTETKISLADTLAAKVDRSELRVISVAMIAISAYFIIKTFFC